MKLTTLDLFSGIGGFTLGLERTGGFRTVQFCEIEPFCRRVLAKHWPGVPIHDDIRTLHHEQVDIVAGGFPCQDISCAGKQEGIDASRSGLWSELARVISETRPRYAIVENVPALLSGGNGQWFGRVLSDLAEIGYDAEWHCISAAHVGAPHIRDRVWVIAYPNSDSEYGQSVYAEMAVTPPIIADANLAGLEVGQGVEENNGAKLAPIKRANWWEFEPAVGRVANGIPGRVDRIKALGNAIVPQIATMLGNAILCQEEPPHAGAKELATNVL